MAYRFLRKTEVLAKLGLKREALRELIDKHNFPPGTQIIPGGRAQGWIEDEVDEFIANRRKEAHKEKGVFPEKGSGKKAAKTMEKSNDDKSRQREQNVNRTDPTRSGQHSARTRGATSRPARSHK
jgi:predicted DNA-binding transcriptional regulator AlpA